jgi:hypothetical protein
VFVARMLKTVGTCSIVVGNPVGKNCSRDLNGDERSGSGDLTLLQSLQTTVDVGVSLPRT